MVRGRDGVAHARVDDVLDRRRDVTHLARGQPLGRPRPRRKPADLIDLVHLTRVHHPDLGPRQDLAVDHPHVGDDAAVGVVMRIEDQGAQRLRRIAVRRRYAVDDGLENLVRPHPQLGRGEDDLIPRDPGYVGDLFGHHLRLSRVEVDLVDDRDDREPRLDRLVQVGKRLRLDPLRRVDHQDRALAGGE